MSDPADGLQIFGFLSDGLNSALDKFVMTSVNQLMSYLSPIVEAGLAIYIVYYGYLVMSGKIETPFQDAMLKMVKIVFIATIATVPGNYYTYVYGFMQDFQNLLVHALNNFGGNVAGSDTVVQVLDQQFSAGMGLVSDAAKHISLHGLTWIFVTAAIAVTLTALFFVAAGLVFLCEIGIAIVAALGPLFVLCLLFPPLANYFDKWLSTFLTLIITTVIAMVSTVICMRFFQNITAPADFQEAGSAAPTWVAMQIMIAGFVMMFLLKQVPHIANSLAGGVGLHGMELSTMLSPAKQTYRQVVKPLGNKIEKLRDERAQYSVGKNSIEPDLPVSPRLSGYGGAAGSYRHIGAFGTYSGNESADGFDLGSNNKLPSIEPSPDDSPRVAAYKRDVADWKTSDAPFAQSIVRAAPYYIRDLQLQEQQAAASPSVNTAANEGRFDINEGFETERAVAPVETASDSSVDSNANNVAGDDSGNDVSNGSDNGGQS